MGIRKGDMLVTINGKEPAKVSELGPIIGQALTIVLVLRRTDDFDVPFPVVAVPLLSVAPAVVRDSMRGEFKVSIFRNTVRQPFGLDFDTTPSHARLGDCVVSVAEDLPHLALKKGDRIVSMNGVQARSKVLCKKILACAMTLDLVVTRDPSDLDLVHDITEIRDGDEDEEEQAEFRAGVLCVGLDCIDTWHERIRLVPGRSAELSGSASLAGPILSEPETVDCGPRNNCHAILDGRSKNEDTTVEPDIDDVYRL